MTHDEALLVTDRLIADERERAHIKHGLTSMRHGSPFGERRLRVLVEEVGEVARVMNEHDHGNIDWREMGYKLIEELVQVAAMASDWSASVSAFMNETQ